MKEKNAITDVTSYTKSQIHECTYCFGKLHKTQYVPRKRVHVLEQKEIKLDTRWEKSTDME